MRVLNYGVVESFDGVWRVLIRFISVGSQLHRAHIGLACRQNRLQRSERSLRLLGFKLNYRKTPSGAWIVGMRHQDPLKDRNCFFRLL